MGKRHSAALLLACLCGHACMGQAAESAWPAREIRFIVPFPPGGGNDTVGRIVARKLQDTLGQSILVENQGGAGGTAGTAIAAKAPPDGYTLLINNISLAINATLFPKLPYDTLKSLQPVSLVGHQPNVLLVAPALKTASVGDFLKLARSRTGGVIYGSGGPGSSSHLAAARLQLATGIPMTHVPYQGLAQALTDLGAGRVEMIVSTISTALPHMSSGKVRALAVTSARRTPLLPKLPTMIESGIADYEVSTWYMVLAPAKTPRPVVAKLSGALATAAADTGVVKQLAALGVDTAHSGPEQAAAYLNSEIGKWGPVIKATGAKPG